MNADGVCMYKVDFIDQSITRNWVEITAKPTHTSPQKFKLKKKKKKSMNFGSISNNLCLLWHIVEIF